MYQNVNRARYTFDISGMTDAEKYNAYKKIRSLYVEKYGVPSISYGFTGDEDNMIILNDFPDVDDSFEFVGDSNLIG